MITFLYLFVGGRF